MSDTNDKDKEEYVFLEFNEKLTPTMFENEIFIRIANLHKPNPLVQINDLVFKGYYDECVGTNLFFDEIENPPAKSYVFEKETAIRLQHFLTQSKIIRLKQMKLPKKMNASKKDYVPVDIDLKQDYNVVLEKLQNNLLNLEDLVKNNNPDEIENVTTEKLEFNTVETVKTEPSKEMKSYVELLQSKSPNSVLEAKYERLRRLAKRPVRRMKSPELVEECEARYKEAYEYNNIECRVLQTSDIFRTRNSPILEKNLIGGVDLDRCVLQGYIPPSNDLFRTLSTSEFNKLLSLDNLDNLSLPARYLVLKECVNKIEELIENTTPEELKEVDENGRNVQDICNIFRKLVSTLEAAISGTETKTNIPFKLISTDDDDYNYVKYKYDPSKEIILDCPEIFDENFEINVPTEVEKEDEEQDDSVEEDDSVE